MSYVKLSLLGIFHMVQWSQFIWSKSISFTSIEEELSRLSNAMTIYNFFFVDNKSITNWPKTADNFENCMLKFQKLNMLFLIQINKGIFNKNGEQLLS